MTETKEETRSVGAFGGVLAILALVGGIASIYTPMQDSIARLQQRLTTLEENFREHELPQNALNVQLKYLEERVKQLEEEFRRVPKSSGGSTERK